MSYADEMKNLVGDIKTSHRERTSDIKNLFAETQELLEADRKELQEMAKELKDFLAKSENTRMADFRAIMKDIGERIEAVTVRTEEVKADARKLLGQFDKELTEMAKDLKAFLAKSETDRKADFKDLIKDVQTRVEAICRDTKGLLSEYKEERKRAAGYWATLKGKTEEAKEATPAAEKPKAEKRKRGRKKK